MEMNKKVVKLEEKYNKYFFSDDELEVYDSEDKNYDFYDENDIDELNFTIKLPDDAEEVLGENLRNFKKVLSEIKHC
jgi:translation elongation factor P/translation initiation factor 5A